MTKKERDEFAFALAPLNSRATHFYQIAARWAKIWPLNFLMKRCNVWHVLRDLNDAIELAAKILKVQYDKQVRKAPRRADVQPVATEPSDSVSESALLPEREEVSGQ